MPYSIKQVPNEPIITGIFYPPLDPANDAAGLLVELNRLVDSIDGEVYYIGDTSRLNLKFADVVQSLSASRDKVRPDKIRYIVVHSDEMSTLAATAWQQKQYGGFEVILVGSVEEGIAYARNDIASKKK